MTYDYICEACRFTWEREQRITETSVKTCPHCHARRAKRLISGSGAFVLKGPRWYADGYGSRSAS